MYGWVLPRRVLTDTIEDPESVSADDVHEEYLDELAAVVEEYGVSTVATEAGLDEDYVTRIRDGSASMITVEDAARVLAVADDRPDAETIQAEVQDHVMLQMSSAVVDVDGLADGIDDDLDPKEVQQKIEGRQPMTLREYAAVHRYLAAENPW